ncbi:MAG: 50S ribosomal protein L9 [Firmicutes bacterium]|nr:50S ribosomal protein L9 [Bacillota bacterium]
MEIILITDVAGLGSEGEVVRVADGYARNYLIPRGLAIRATKSNLQALKAKKKTMKIKSKRELASAKEIAEQLGNSKIIVYCKAGEGGRLFGSVTSKDIADTVKSDLGITLDRRRIDLTEPIKAVGNYTVSVKLHSEVSAEIQVEVKPQQEGE